jgi:hypothetical protein
LCSLATQRGDPEAPADSLHPLGDGLKTNVPFLYGSSLGVPFKADSVVPDLEDDYLKANR